jgi:cytoskeletal protein RodZ
MGLDQIGQKLKAAREGQGLSLAQIYERTKIPTNHLQSIDDGQVDELPEPVYVAGFIKRYGDCVGLNGQSLSDEYRRQNNNGGSSNGDSGSGWGSRLIAQPMLTAQPFTARSGLEVRAPNVFKQALFYSVLIVVVLGCFSFLFAWQSNYQLNLQSDSANQLLKRDYRGALSGAQPQTPGSASQPPTETQAPGTTAPGATEAPPPEAEASVSLNASKHVWLNVTAISSGQSLYEGYMESGERKDFKDPQGVRVRAGNGASVSVDYQGKSETLGAAGKVAEKSFMSKSASTAAVPDPKAQAAAAAALKAASVKKAVKTKVASDTAAHKHSRASDDSSRADSAARAPENVPYRYTESADDH